MTARGLLLVAAIILAILSAGPLAAQGAPVSRPPTPDDPARLDALTREVSSELRCPVCQGESIQESPAELAQEMKGVVREQLAAGRTPDEVKAYFVDRYGEWILLRPRASGFNALLYWLPPIALLAGIAIVILLARRWIAANARAGTGTPS